MNANSRQKGTRRTHRGPRSSHLPLPELPAQPWAERGWQAAGATRAALGYLGTGSSEPRSSVETAFKEGLLLGRCFAMSTLRLLGHRLQAPCTKPSASGHRGCHSGSVLSQQHKKARTGPLLRAWMQTHSSWACQHHADCHPSYGTLLPEVCCHALARHLSQSRGRGRWHFFSVGSGTKQQSVNSAQDEQLSSVCSNRCAH